MRRRELVVSAFVLLSFEVRSAAQQPTAAPEVLEGASDEPAARDEETNVDVEPSGDSADEPFFEGFGAEAEVTPLDEREHDRRRVEVVSSAPIRRGDDLGRAFERLGGARFVRTGGLGASTRIELDGFVGERVRLFVDGLPLDVAGYAFDPSVTPLGRARAVEVHRGVVPLRLGADALGGVVEIVTAPPARGADVALLTRVGSFRTARTLGRAAWRGERGGFVDTALHADRAANDYRIRVEIPDEDGRPRPTHVRRFHDGYRSVGGRAEVGVLERGPVVRASVSAHVSGYTKELPHDPAMRVPYGETRYGERLGGAVLRLELGDEDLSMSSVVAVASRRTALHDVAQHVYDWRGEIVGSRPLGGEIDGTPRSFLQRRDDVFARVVGTWRRRAHRLGVGSTIRADRTSGRTRVGLSEDEIDPLRAPRRTVRVASGVEHHAELADGRLATVVFVKHHHLQTRAESLRVAGALVPVSSRENRMGPGAAVRVTWWPERLFTKIAYEHAVRLPSTNEVFGDGILVQPGGELSAERSHNVVASLSFEAPLAETWRLDGDLRGVARRTLDQIQLLTLGNGFEHVNLSTVRGIGVEGAVRARSTAFAIEGRATYQDLRNRSREGAYARFVNDRVPNIPWLFADFGGAWTLERGVHSIELSADLRYVHGFLRDWESLGAPGARPSIPAQLFGSLAIDWRARVRDGEVGARLDVRNVTSSRRFDAFGAQLPGREFVLTVEGRVR